MIMTNSHHLLFKTQFASVIQKVLHLNIWKASNLCLGCAMGALGRTNKLIIIITVIIILYNENLNVLNDSS